MCYMLGSSRRGYLVQQAEDIEKPVTFRNQTGQNLQAISMPGVSISKQPLIVSSQTNQNFFHLCLFYNPNKNLSLTVIILPTISSFNMQSKSSTNITTTITMQPSTDNTQISATTFPTSTFNESTLQTHYNTTSVQAYSKTNVHDQSKTKSYEHDSLTNKRTKCHPMVQDTIITIPNVTTTMIKN
ncbi:unnamed protein product [Rotaria sp. Silwood1]|nr:unnamed protein product [Rotaria sp. Silwood1]CAF1655612.1 unnamed protein product [Rotaria sp. Silwood1]